MKKLNKKGFTLAELLIVVAIIAVLVAIAIPVFTDQLEKSREAVDASNIRAEYAELMAAVLTDSYDATNDATKYVVTLKQIKNDWQNTNDKSGLEGAGMTLTGTPSKNGKATLTYDSETEKVTVTFAAGSASTGS